MSAIEDGAKSVIGIVTSIIGLAILAVVLSKSSNTVSVMTSFFGGISKLISVAVSPISGGSTVALTGGTSSIGSASNVPSNGSVLADVNAMLGGANSVVKSAGTLSDTISNLFTG